jgi:hypothetical protein
MTEISQNGAVDFEPPLTQDSNERACQIVISSIARYPQDSRGQVLIANELMKSFDSAKKNTINIQELSKIAPNAVDAADTINRIHEQFHIPRTVTPQEAEGFIVDFTIGTLDRLRLYSKWEAEELQMPYPDILNKPVFNRPEGEKKMTPTWIDKSVAAGLQQFLEDNTVVRERVTNKITAEAKEVTADSKNQQNRASSGDISHF